MANNANMYYGVTVDGLSLKIAELENSHGQFKLLRVQSFNLAKPLYDDYGRNGRGFSQPSEGVSLSAAPGDPESALNDMDLSGALDFDLGGSGGFDSPLLSDSFGQKDKNETSDGLYKFLGQFSLDKGRVSFSALDGKTEWKMFKMNKKPSLIELKKQVLSDAQIKDDRYQVDFVEHKDLNFSAVIHNGDFEIQKLLDNASQLAYNSRKPFLYKYAEPIEISMLNLFNLFYNSMSSKYTTLLYIGEESKLGIVIKDREIVKTFPIMVGATEPDKIREAVLSKLILEQENSNCPLLENIVVAGSYATSEDVQFYNTKTGNSHTLFEIDPALLNKRISFNVSGSIDTRSLPSYIVAVSLALRGALDNSKLMLPFNLLGKTKKSKGGGGSRTKSASSGDGVLKWHGTLLILLVIAIAFFGNRINGTSKRKLTNLQEEYDLANRELQIKKNFVDQMNYLEGQIENVMQIAKDTNNIARVKNSWSEMLTKISEFSNKNPMVWVELLESKDAKVELRGKSYHRDRISQLAGLFEGAKINRIFETQIQDHNVWSYEINFPRPHLPAIDLNKILPDHLVSYEAYKLYMQELALKNRQVNVPPPVVETKVPEPVKTTTPPPPSTPPSTPKTTTPPPAPKNTESLTLYNKAKDSYMNSNFEEAVSSLDAYIERYPQGVEIALVYYLKGEINYVRGNFDKAIENYTNVYKLKKDKAAESLFFTAKAYEGLHDYENAKLYYHILIREYPKSSQATTANEQLKILNGEYK